MPAIEPCDHQGRPDLITGLPTCTKRGARNLGWRCPAPAPGPGSKPDPVLLGRGPNVCHFGKHTPKCRHDHRLKQHPGWKVEQLPDGTFRWTTPSGRQCTTEPTRYPI